MNCPYRRYEETGSADQYNYCGKSVPGWIPDRLTPEFILPGCPLPDYYAWLDENIRDSDG